MALNSEKLKSRNIGLDLMRIFAMFGIVILHILGAGGVLSNLTPDSPKYFIAWLLEISAMCSVDLFALLSGYLSGSKTRFSAYRIIDLLVTVGMYCVLITALFLVFDSGSVGGLKGIIKSLVPALVGRYWYITCYTALFFLMPYINVLINKIDDKSFGKFCLILILLFSVLPSFIPVDFFKLSNGYSAMWLIICYILGAYLRRSEKMFFKNREVLVFLASALIVLSFKVPAIFGIGETLQYMSAYVSPFVLLCAVMLLQLGARMKTDKVNINFKKVIVALSAVAFDVYIIHSHILVFDNIMTDGFKWIIQYNAALLPLIVIALTIVIYIFCALVGKLRETLFSVTHLNKLFKLIAVRADKLLGWSDN